MIIVLRSDWAKLSRQELQTLLRCFGLPTEGINADLVQRLAERTNTGSASTVDFNARFNASASPTVQRPVDQFQLCTRPELAVFDVETTIPRFKGETMALLEFGAIIVDSKTMVEDPQLRFNTLIRPRNLKLITKRSIACNSITAGMVSEAPVFQDVANKIYRALDGRIWVGHHINRVLWM